MTVNPQPQSFGTGSQNVGMPWAENPKLTAAIEALLTWEASANSQNAHIVTITFLLDTTDPNSATAVATWDNSAGQYRVVI